MFGWLKRKLRKPFCRHQQKGQHRSPNGQYAKKPLWMRDPIVAEQVREWEKKYHCKYKLKG